MEIILRIFHVGHDPRYFIRKKDRNGVYCIDNPAFTRRFFPPALARPLDKVRFSLRKGDHQRRIFVFGASAAEGEPAPAFGFSRQLDVMLRERHGATHCEVINTAITAVNSHVVLPIARECSRLSPGARVPVKA